MGPLKRKKIDKREALIFLICFFALANVRIAFAADQGQDLKEQPQEAISRSEVAYEAEGLRDPFLDYKPKKAKVEVAVTKPTPPPKPPSVRISGIVWGGEVPQAIVNNKIVKVGDTVEGDIQIIGITKAGITVLYKDLKYNYSSPAAGTLGQTKNKPKEE